MLRYMLMLLMLPPLDTLPYAAMPLIRLPPP